MTTILLFLLFSFTAHAGTEGHGGDEVALEFLTALNQGIEEVSRRSSEAKAQLEAAGLPALASSIKIVVRDEPLFVVHEGATQESIAVNYRATNLVEINRARWKALPTPRLKQAIALHEALSLKGLEQTGYYPISGPFAASFGYKEAAIRTGNLPTTEGAKNGQDFFTQKCTQLTTMLYNKDKQRYVVQADKTGGAKIWKQGSTEFSLDYSDIFYDLTGDSVSLTLSRTEVLEKNAQNITVRSKSDKLLYTVRGKKLETLKGTVEQSVEVLNAEESLNQLIVNGKPGSLVRTTQKDLGNKQTLFVQRNEQAELNPDTDVLVESHVSSCISLEREPEEIKTLAHPAIQKAVESFDQKIQAVTLAQGALELCQKSGVACEPEQKLTQAAITARDQAWPKIINPKVFLPKPKPKARPTYRGGNNSGGGGNSGDSGGGSRYEPFPATDLRDRFGRPVYKDRFGTYKDARGFPINPWNIKDEVRDRYGRSICDDFFNRPMFGCR